MLKYVKTIAVRSNLMSILIIFGTLSQPIFLLAWQLHSVLIQNLVGFSIDDVLVPGGWRHHLSQSEVDHIRSQVQVRSLQALVLLTFASSAMGAKVEACV